ncbi:MAG: NAD(P)/FAD-dependent oxidoreductase [Verrucomicrobia bacterium]|nr:NAD(P)/FAD-dependent oxidoreductase [Verrucomicrobiota bacterium]
MTLQRLYFRVVAAGVGGGDQDEAAMRATLGSIGAFVDSVPRTNTVTWKALILEHLRGRSDIDSAGDMGDGVWAITTDGIPLSFWNNRLVDPPVVEEPFAFPMQAGTETSGTTTARFSVTVGAGFRQSAPALARMVAAKGYRPVADNASLASLKGTRSESIFFFNTHGGDFFVPLFGADGKPLRGTNNFIRYQVHYGLWTGQRIDPNFTDPNYRHQEFVADLKAKRLAIAYAPAFYVTGTGGFQSAVNEWRFGITAEWVKHYLRFPAENHASVWLGACLSGSPEAAAMRAAFLSVGADMVSGWTDNVNGDAVYVSTAFVWDRLLGANNFQPPATPQRPFDYDEVWTELLSFRRGTAIFTMPDTPTRCGGAPQKIMWLAEDYLRRKGLRGKSRVLFVSGGKSIFGVPHYRAPLEAMIARRGIETLFRHRLVEVRGTQREAVFESLEAGDQVVIPYQMLHVTPPMSAPDFIKRSPLADSNGWVDTDAHTLQHRRWPDIFALGDVANLPTSKTGAAIRKQAPVLVRNLLAHRHGAPLDARYNGYTSCPIVTGYGRLMLAEFDYDDQPAETFPVNQAKERRSMWLLKRYVLPFLYWHGMLKGRA